MGAALVRALVRLQGRLPRLGGAEEGQGLVEYALIIALIAVAVVVAIVAAGGEIKNIFNHIANCLSNVSGC